MNVWGLLRSIEVLFDRMTQKPLELLPNSPDIFREYRGLLLYPHVERKPGGWFYKGKFYPDYLTVGGASHAIFRKALSFCVGFGVDIGAGLWPLPGAIAVDIWRGPGAGKRIEDFQDNTLEYVFSSHCLEHIEPWREALVSWLAKIKIGGIIFLYLPHPECAIWEPGSPFVGDGHRWSPTPQVMGEALSMMGCQIVDRDNGPDAMYSFYVCARKIK